MQRFQVRAGDGRKITVEAVDWMMALCQAIEQFDIEVSSWLCDNRPDGTVLVTDPMSGATFLVRPARPEGSAKPSVEPAVPREAWPSREIPLDTEAPPEDLAERLFELSTDLTEAGDPHAACRRALEILLELVPSEAGSVLRGTLNDASLTFVAAAGPAAEDILGRELPFGRGVAGAAFDQGVVIQVNDVTNDPRHDPSFDAQTGFHTRSLLCVPVSDGEGYYGAIELLNPPRRFLDWHVEAARTVARSLAVVLAAA